MGKVRRAALQAMVAMVVFAVVLLVTWVVYRHNQNTFYDQHGNLFRPLHLRRLVGS